MLIRHFRFGTFEIDDDAPTSSSDEGPIDTTGRDPSGAGPVELAEGCGAPSRPCAVNAGPRPGAH